MNQKFNGEENPEEGSAYLQEGKQSEPQTHGEEKKNSKNIHRATREYMQLPTHRKIELWRKLGYEGTWQNGEKPFFEWVKLNDKSELFCRLLLIPFVEEPANPVASNTGVRFVNVTERLPEGVTSFKTMSKNVAVHYYSEYDKAIITASGRYCHDRNKWYVPAQNEKNNNECNVIEWLDESSPSASGDELAKEYTEAQGTNYPIEPIYQGMIKSQIGSAFLAGFAAGKGEGDAVEFGEFIVKHCSWVVSQKDIGPDEWGWETDLPEHKRLYSTRELYNIFVNTKNTIKWGEGQKQ